ncbi:MAG: hypothetical protein FJW40_19210 [Acidobacteria bacterium]|nr:hypothetical protein [Acidobacteriota bacterium]
MEMAFHTVLYQAEAFARGELPRFPKPAEQQRSLPCSCGRPARYRELDIENGDRSPEVRRMHALVGRQAIGQDAIKIAERFGRRLYLGAWTRGWSRAPMKVVIGGGAERIRNPTETEFPCAIQIVDIYPARQHARQHLWEVARALYPSDAAQQKGWMKVYRNVCWITTRSRGWSPVCAPSTPMIPKQPKRSASKPTTSIRTPKSCVTPSSVANTSLSAPASLKQAAKL